MEHVIYQVCFVIRSDATYSKFSKVLITFLFRFSIEMLVIRAGCHKMLVRITNSEDPGQTEAVLSGYMLFV